MNTFAEKDVGAAWRHGVLSRYARTEDDNSTFESSRFSPSACGVRATRDRTLLMTTDCFKSRIRDLISHSWHLILFHHVTMLTLMHLPAMKI